MNFRRNFGLFSGFLLFFLLLNNIAFSQFFIPFGNVDKARATGYGADTLFIFYSTNQYKEIGIVHSTDDTADFTWSRFNDETQNYDSLFTHTSKLSSTIQLDSLYQKGMLNNAMEAFQVEVVSDEDSMELYRCWVLTDTFPDFGEIRINENSCQKLWLEIDKFTLPNYTYYRLSDSSYAPLTLYNNRQASWSSSEDVDIHSPDVLYDLGNILIGKIGSVSGSFGSSEFIGPYEDSDYYLTVTNSFDNSRKDTILNIPAKAVLADFEVKKYDEEGSESSYSENEINEALLQVGFENKSKNENWYHWVGYNDSLNILNGQKRVLWDNYQETPSLDSIPKYTPGKYPVELFVKNEHQCIDSMTFYHISVDSSKIDSAMIPNVFTPNGDGANDVLVLPKKDNLTGGGERGLVSMKSIEVTIMNRNGQLVYKYEGNPLDWEGWKGKVKNSNRDAAEGIYLYVIRGSGYDGVEHESKNYTGFLYLFR